MKIPVCTPNQRTLVATFKPKRKKTQRLSTPKLTKKHVKHAQKETHSLVSPIPWKPRNPTRRTCSHPKSVCFGSSESATNTVKRLLFCWAFPVFWRGYRRGRTDLTDLPPVPRRDRFLLNDISLHVCFCVFFRLFQDGRDNCRIRFTNGNNTNNHNSNDTDNNNQPTKQASKQPTNKHRIKQTTKKQQTNNEQTTNTQQQKTRIQRHSMAAHVLNFVWELKSCGSKCRPMEFMFASPCLSVKSVRSCCFSFF